MCRLAAYLGPSILLDQFLLQPPHNLIKQSWAPEEMEEAVLNADGFGIGWYIDESHPGTYLNTQPAWADINLPSLSLSISSSLWLANVRSATPGQMTGLANTQPFTSGNLIYMHNGYINNFNMGVRQRFHEYLSPEIQAGIKGNTDSEYLFALFRHHLQKNTQEITCLFKITMESLVDILKGETALLNVIISDGKSIYALRHAIDKKCPSLYYTNNDKHFYNASVIASERMTTDKNWQPVPEHSLVILNTGRQPEVISL